MRHDPFSFFVNIEINVSIPHLRKAIFERKAKLKLGLYHNLPGCIDTYVFVPDIHKSESLGKIVHTAILRLNSE